MSEEIPVYEVECVRTERGGWVAEFDCPCGRRHTHSGSSHLDDGCSPDGHRIAHCAPVNHLYMARRHQVICPCGKRMSVGLLQREDHAAHVDAAERHYKTGYILRGAA